jgi:hypothetical protein
LSRVQARVMKSARDGGREDDRGKHVLQAASLSRLEAKLAEKRMARSL